MRVLVDTPVWSLALRKKKQNSDSEVKLIHTLTELIEDSAVRIIGPIRQEILSGIASTAAFSMLKEKLDFWKDIEIEAGDYVRAAEMFNLCRKHGIQGSHIDFLICAVSEKNNLAIFTLDNDFSSYAKHLPISLFNLLA